MFYTVDTPYILNASSKNFNALVMDNSKRGPVLVNFCSHNASNCSRLSIVLEKLVRQYDGNLLLINIDTENELVFAKRYAITTVPTLLLFQDKRVVETFHGYKTEQELRVVLDKYVRRESDKIVADAIHHYSEGRRKTAYELIVDGIVNDPINPRLPLALCKMLNLEKRYKEATKIITALNEDIRNYKEIVQLDAQLFFLNDIDQKTEMNDLLNQQQFYPKNIEIKRQILSRYVEQKRYDEALQELVNIILLNQAYDNNYSRIAVLKIFDIIGEHNSLVAKYRPYLKRFTH